MSSVREPTDQSREEPVVVVTGANSGIGRATAIHLAGRGYRVIGTVRSATKADKLRAMAESAGVGVELVELDVAIDQSVGDGFAEIFDRAGRVDHLVNNAGVGGNATVEDCSVELFAEVMNINLYGAVRCQQAVLPQMRERGAGTVINVSSVVGRIAALAQAPYTASKWALEAMSEQLAQEVASFGIRVAIIEPGITKSAIFAKNIDMPEVTGAYAQQYQRMFQMYAAGLAHATDPMEVGAVIAHAIETETPQLRYPVSWGGAEIISGRDAMTDEEWVALGRVDDDLEYYERFAGHFGVRIAPD